jgi:hypothetical protein
LMYYFSRELAEFQIFRNDIVLARAERSGHRRSRGKVY